ncbi:MAG: SAM-dependent methyltransferase [Verrucomicrobiales bacterium]|jgi:SAM-dependent MidA family methyltransferase|nr:SAM-dependent methyltransferase [Verrucomicrobiales bacterium]
MKSPGMVLRELLSANGGKVTFAQFMQAALYDPEHGYYTRYIKTVGRSGDFSTSATIHPILARAIANWIVEYGGKTLGKGSWQIIEVGPGSGQMAYWVKKFLPLMVRLRVKFHLVESSPVLREKQKILLSRHRVAWHRDIQSALRKCDGRALIYSNEVVDAFPCVQLVKQDGDWQEIFLEQAGDQIRERSGPPVSKFKKANFSVFRHLAKAANGQRCELHESYREWLAEWVPLWKKGAMLTIDYGDSAGRLYERRPQGSLRAYFQHNVLEGIDLYQRMGRQDLTADVNFTDLEYWGQQLSLTTEFFQTQADFMLKRVRSANSDAEKMLLHPDGAGQAFKVLCQSRGA